MHKATSWLFILVSALAAAAGVVLIAGQWSAAEDERQGKEFYHLVGGFGFGPAIDAAACEFSVDPRCCPSCSFDTGPVPGGVFFCPYHACSTFPYPFPASRWEPRPDAILP